MMSPPDSGESPSSDDDGDDADEIYEDSDWWEGAAEERLDLWVHLIERAAQLGYVARACEELGVHRTAFYRIWQTHRRGGRPALFDLARRAVARSAEGRHRLETAVLRMTAQHPSWGRKRIAKALNVHGYAITAAQVLNVWRRHDLNRPERNPASKS
jgi:hypothetical protein